MLPTSLGPRPSSSGIPLVSPFVLYLFVFLSILPFASAQLVNGQFYTNALAISDGPAPSSQNNAGSSLNIAIELSGDGKLPQQAFLPTSTAATAYQSLNLYLVSAETNLNISVSEGPGLLQQEPGSTVKHLSWPIPACVPAGNYNLTYYELSRIDQISYYSITPIPIVIKSKSTSPCTNGVPLSPQPQGSSPPPQQPWLTPGYTITTAPISPSTTQSSNPSGSLSSSGSAVVTTTPNSSQTGVITITLSPSPTTVTFVSTMVVPTTLNGISTVFTTATTIASVSTVVPSGSGSLIPVNSAVSVRPLNLLAITILWACILATGTV